MEVPRVPTPVSLPSVPTISDYNNDHIDHQNNSHIEQLPKPISLPPISDYNNDHIDHQNHTHIEIGLLVPLLDPDDADAADPESSDLDCELYDAIQELDLKESDELSVRDEIRELGSKENGGEGEGEGEVEVEGEGEEEGVGVEKEEAEKSSNGKETEKENGSERQSEESDGGGEENKSENGSGVEEKMVDESSRRYQYPVRPEAEDCSYYLKTGTCKFGSHCKFNHPVKRKNNQVFKDKPKERQELPENPGQTECKYYLRAGGCKYGKTCRYNHGRGKPSVAPILEHNFLGLPIRPGERECPYYMRNGSCKYGSNCRFNHPDPTAAGGSDPPSGYGTGGPASLPGAPQSTVAPWSAPRSLNETPLYVSMMIPPSQGVPSQNTEWNGYQAPVYLPERSMPVPPPLPYVMNNTVMESNIYKQYPQPKQVEEFPERPGQPVCSYFLRRGDCKFKSNCKYHHPKNQTAVSPSFSLSDKGLPLRPDQNICTHYSRYGICKFGPACKFDHPLLVTSSTTSGLDHQLPFSDSTMAKEAGTAGSRSGTDTTIQPQPV